MELAVVQFGVLFPISVLQPALKLPAALTAGCHTGLCFNETAMTNLKLIVQGLSQRFIFGAFPVLHYATYVYTGSVLQSTKPLDLSKLSIGMSIKVSQT